MDKDVHSDDARQETEMKNKTAGAAMLALLVAAVVVLRRVGPTLAERGMKKCHEMMAGHMSQARPAEQAVQGDVRTEAESESAGPDADQPRPVAVQPEIVGLLNTKLRSAAFTTNRGSGPHHPPT